MGSRPRVRGIRSRPLRRIARRALAQRFVLDRANSGHLRLTCPTCSRWVTFSASLRERDHRAHLNIRAMLRAHGFTDSTGAPLPGPDACRVRAVPATGRAAR
ncbi:hypothetical protein [Streptomyces sp. CAU 1734]|uniref:hypothetical protein n=1 Tax=Streptomyces sp. CAU 1734 TaxID=3140360 RepID=UPI0032608615